MLLPENFVFTQQNLQDYVDCHRRFYNREVLHLEWPAIESEPIREMEELMELGTRFHLLCQQYFSGIPMEDLAEQIDSIELTRWWNNFLGLNLLAQPGLKSAEKLISIPFGGYRLAAKLDLLIVHPSGEIKIYDWKTSRFQPKRQFMLNKMQSKVYPLVVSSYQNSINGNPTFTPEKMEMNYWYPEFPDSPITFFYSEKQKLQDELEISQVITEIINKKERDDFNMTDNEKKCSYCRFRSLCNRGISAGINEENEVELDENIFDIEFDTLD